MIVPAVARDHFYFYFYLYSPLGYKSSQSDVPRGMQNKVGFAGAIHFLRQTFEDYRHGCEVSKATITPPEKGGLCFYFNWYVIIFFCYVYSNDNLNL